MNRENERQVHNEFLKKYEQFYDELVRILSDCVGRNDVKELSLHINYISKCIEQALRLRLIIQKENERSGNV